MSNEQIYVRELGYTCPNPHSREASPELPAVRHPT